MRMTHQLPVFRLPSLEDTLVDFWNMDGMDFLLSQVKLKYVIIIYFIILPLLKHLSQFKPPLRAKAWHEVPTSLPTLVSTPTSLLPVDTVTLSYPWEFVKSSSPVNQRNAKQWTANERLRASKAILVSSINELEKEVMYFIYIHIHDSHIDFHL